MDDSLGSVFVYVIVSVSVKVIDGSTPRTKNFDFLPDSIKIYPSDFSVVFARVLGFVSRDLVRINRSFSLRDRDVFTSSYVLT